MKKNIFFLTLILSASFFVFNNASADFLDLIKGSDISVADSEFYVGTIHQGAFTTQTYIYFYLDDIYNIKKIRFSAKQPTSYGATGDYTLHIGQGGNYSNITELDSVSFDYTELTSNFQNYVADVDIHYTSTSTPFWIWFTTSGYGSPAFGLDSYSSPQDFDFSAIIYTSQYGTYTNTDPYYPDLGIYAIPDSTISINYPVNNSQNLAQFTAFTGRFINYYNPNGLSDFIIKYGLSPDNLDNEVSKLNTQFISTTDDGEDNYYISAPNFSEGKTYYARAFLRDSGTGINLATSTIISFNMAVDLSYQPINDTGLTYNPLPTATTTASTTAQVFISSCNASQNIISYSSCLLFSWLFTPNETTLNKWADLKNELSDKPPFGYSAYFSTFASISQATTTKQTDLFDNLASLNDVLFSKIRALLVIILWFSFAFYLMKRLKHIEL